MPGAKTGSIEAGGNGHGSAANQFDFPQSVFADAAGNIYVADAGNNRIQKWVPGATEGITVAGGNSYRSAADQLDYPSGPFVDAEGNLYVADRYNERIQKFIFTTDLPVYPANLTVAAPSCSGKATIRWNEPHDTFPATISIPRGVNLASASLIYKGTFNGHGYYQSNDEYSWINANDAAKIAPAHLVTITSAAEINFVFTNLNKRYNYA